ncbi:MAG TPA: M48 family metalloprotease [Planctomycetota bacterium]|nr:M48 family metalloprotease [Planctomycetota bacterium]
MKKWAAILGVLGFAAVAGCGSPERLTESQEYYVGRGVAASAVVATDGLVQGELEAYVNLVGLTVSMESDRPDTHKGYFFGVLKSDAVNAFAAPGGFIFVTTGALKKMENEDELAGVLAHEVAHVNLRHPEESANKATQKSGVMGILSKGEHLGTAGAIAGGALTYFGQAKAGDAVKTAGENLAKVVKAFGGVLDGMLEELMVNGYGRESELQADAFAVDLLTRPGVRYDPSALGAFVGRLPKSDRGAWSTHPELEGRVKNIQDEVKKRGVKSAVDPERTKRFLAMKVALGL